MISETEASPVVKGHEELPVDCSVSVNLLVMRG